LIVLFGAAYVAPHFISLASILGITVSYLVDNDEKKIGASIGGKKIYRPSPELLDGHYILIMSAVSHRQIARQLQEMGYQDQTDFLSIAEIRDRITIKSLEAICGLGKQADALSNAFFFCLKNVPMRNISVFQSVLGTVLDSGNVISGKKVLEIGFGNSLIAPIMFLLAGAQFVKAIDKSSEPDAFDCYQYRLLAGDLLAYHSIIPVICETPIGTLFERFYDCISFKGSQISANQNLLSADGGCDVTQLAEDDKRYQIIYSNSVLEHIETPESAIAAITKCASPGCITHHYIDLSDHIDPTAPPAFYSTGIMESQKRVTLNGLRQSDWSSLFRSFKWKILSAETQLRCAKKALKKYRLHSDFKSYDMDDLERLDTILIARYEG